MSTDDDLLAAALVAVDGAYANGGRPVARVIVSSGYYGAGRTGREIVTKWGPVPIYGDPHVPPDMVYAVDADMAAILDNPPANG